jgi:D-psicose/D-tagatose/L-ribulose 3-epimerase
MKLSISNLAWGEIPLDVAASRISDLGMDGIEIAPTLLWENFESISSFQVLQTKKMLSDQGLSVSGIQSLLYGHPELQLFDQSTWQLLRNHLTLMIETASTLSAKVVVFGSPKNRVKGKISKTHANQMATDFFSTLIPVLESNDITLTLEPNAPQYGADFLMNYREVVELSQQIGSEYIAPQIDTGCLWMVGEQPSIEFQRKIPHHTHISTPNLGRVPGDWNFGSLFEIVRNSGYKGWVVIESFGNSLEEAVTSAKWLTSELRSK